MSRERSYVYPEFLVFSLLSSSAILLMLKTLVAIGGKGGESDPSLFISWEKRKQRLSWKDDGGTLGQKSGPRFPHLARSILVSGTHLVMKAN